MPDEKPDPQTTGPRELEYLSNERTFLAWIRTAVAVISLGFVIARFSLWLKEIGLQLHPERSTLPRGASLPMGETMIIIGALLPLLAAWRYHVVNKAIEQGRIQADRQLVGTVAISLSFLGAAMAIYLVHKAGE